MRIFFIILSAISLSLFSCKTTSGIQISQEPNSNRQIELVFAGDIMAHTEITRKNMDSTFEDIKEILKTADFSFANFESPIDDKLPVSSYPTFNCHKDYAIKAMEAGFNVFSLANNHSNDFFKEGIDSTKKIFDEKKSEGIYSTGLKDNADEEIEFIVLEKNGWKILFAAVTEVLNFKKDIEFFNYVKPEKNERENFLRLLKVKKEKSGCDLLIVSFHTQEEEYVTSIAEKSKKFYYSIIDSGADILWVNHPHVAKSWETINTAENKQKIIFYSVGNTISAQRRTPGFDNPNGKRDFTGDSFLFRVVMKKENEHVMLEQIEPVLITTFINKKNEFVIKQLNDEFIKQLREEGNIKWADYLLERKKIMNTIEGIISWQ